MISNDERREVAARLREQKPWSVFTDFQDCIGDLCDAVFDDEGDLNDMFGLKKSLADLIEPEPERTCHFRNDGHGILWCDADGCDYDMDDYFPIPNYCQNCGAKVVE